MSKQDRFRRALDLIDGAVGDIAERRPVQAGFTAARERLAHL